MKRSASLVAAAGFLLLTAAACHEDPAPAAPTVDAAAPSKPRRADDSCRAASDCLRSTIGESCCDVCEPSAQSRTHFTSERDRCSSVVDRKCPKLDCPYERKEVDCVKGQCALRAPLVLQVAETSVRPLVPKALPKSDPRTALEVPEATYKPFASDGGNPKAYFVAFYDEEARVEVFADNRSFKGKLASQQPVANTKFYELDDGFGGGRFTVLTQPDGARRATFTVFGSGVPIISSERGPLVPGK